MRTLTILFLLLFFPLRILIAQGLTTDWINHFPCSSTSWGQDLTLDHTGNIYSGGYFHGTIDTDPGASNVPLTAMGVYDIFVTKSDNNGGFIWSRQFGGTGYTSLSNIVTDLAGNCIFAGYFEGTIDADPGTGVVLLQSASGSRDMFIIKLDPAGNFLWGKKGSGPDEQSASGLATDGSNNIYLGCRFETQLDFPPQLISASSGEPDGALLKLDPNGNLLWLQRYGGTSSDVIYDVKTDAAGNVILCGHFGLSVDFDPGPSAHVLSCGTRTGFVLKLDPAGNFIWARQLQQPAPFESCSLRSLRIGPTGNLHLAGVTMGDVDLDPGPGTHAVSGIANGTSFLMKLDPDGNFIHGFTNTNGYTGSTGICAGPNDQTWYFGHSLFQIDLDPSIAGTYLHPHAGSSDMFIQQFDANGQFLGAEYIAGSGWDTEGNIVCDNIGAVYLTGSFSDTVDFDLSGNGQDLFVSASASGSTNPFLQKLQMCGNVTYGDTIYDTSCVSLMYEGVEYTNSGIYTLVTDNAEGCDSIFSLGLTIQYPTFSTIDTILCEGTTAILNGIAYDSPGFYSQTIPNANGCDSVIDISVAISSIDTDVSLFYDTTLHSHYGGGTYQWINCDNGEAIPGATEINFSPSVNGSYAAQLTGPDGCTAMTECHIVSVLGMAESVAAPFSVYPNPCSDLLYIVSGENARYVIHAADGRLIATYGGTAGIAALDVSGYSKGIYRISIIDPYGTLVHPLTFVKQ